jgi:hypothetical protein
LADHQHIATRPLVNNEMCIFHPQIAQIYADFFPGSAGCQPVVFCYQAKTPPFQQVTRADNRSRPDAQTFPDLDAAKPGFNVAFVLAIAMFVTCKIDLSARGRRAGRIPDETVWIYLFRCGGFLHESRRGEGCLFH